MTISHVEYSNIACKFHPFHIIHKLLYTHNENTFNSSTVFYLFNLLYCHFLTFVVLEHKIYIFISCPPFARLKNWNLNINLFRYFHYAIVLFIFSRAAYHWVGRRLRSECWKITKCIFLSPTLSATLIATTTKCDMVIDISSFRIAFSQFLSVKTELFFLCTF